MSSEYVEKLKRRAKAFLLEAKRVEDPDLAMFFAEQAAQLYMKAVHYELFGSMVRGHRLRELLALLIKSLDEHSYHREAEKLLEFVDKNRRILIMLEEAYTMSRYGDVEYTRSEADRATVIVEELLNLLEEVCRNAKLG